jgi:AcrR family transcriptional regulator
VARTRNDRRPEELLGAITRYVVEHGLADLSLRPLAKAVGSSPRVLLYYFGSKEELVAAIFVQVREWQRKTLLVTGESNTLEGIARRAWSEIVRPGNMQGLEFFYECFGQAVRHRKEYKDFLKGCFEDWIDRFSTVFINGGADQESAQAMATILLSGLRGFALDYCATRDRARVEKALELWIEAMGAQTEIARS